MFIGLLFSLRRAPKTKLKSVTMMIHYDDESVISLWLHTRCYHKQMTIPSSLIKVVTSLDIDWMPSNLHIETQLRREIFSRIAIASVLHDNEFGLVSQTLHLHSLTRTHVHTHTRTHAQRVVSTMK